MFVWVTINDERSEPKVYTKRSKLNLQNVDLVHELEKGGCRVFLSGDGENYLDIRESIDIFPGPPPAPFTRT